MTQANQYSPLVVQQIETDKRIFAIHTCDRFDLIFIRRGSGKHFVNGSRSMYQDGDLFFLGPLDNHHFCIEKTTLFSSISFTELYIGRLTGNGANTWSRIIDYSSHKYPSMLSNILMDGTEKQHVQVLTAIILAEQTNNNPLASRLIIDSLMQTILSLVNQKLGMYPSSPSPPSLLQRIMAYISQHITEPHYLRMENLSDIFNYSPGHLSALFKRQAGESIQQYIIRYRLRMVEIKLSHDTMSISQIADEFGFTDVCHLNKLFKQYYHQTPTHYRSQQAVNINIFLRL